MTEPRHLKPVEEKTEVDWKTFGIALAVLGVLLALVFVWAWALFDLPSKIRIASVVTIGTVFWTGVGIWTFPR